jgi:hypothetical protein
LKTANLYLFRLAKKNVNRNRGRSHSRSRSRNRTAFMMQHDHALLPE